MRSALCLLTCAVVAQAQARPPSAAVAYSCLSARSVASSVQWQQFPTDEIYAQDDYKDGFDAVYYIIVAGIKVGYAKKADREAIIYGGKLFPLECGRPLHGFVGYPAELNPRMAEWGSAADSSGKFLCISFPFGEIGQS